MIELEKSIIEGFPSDIKYIARDGSGELWATVKKPTIINQGDKQFLEFGADVTMNEMYSLAIYNHMFKYIENLSIMFMD